EGTVGRAGPVSRVSPAREDWKARRRAWEDRMVTVSVADPVSIDLGHEMFQPEPALDGLRVLLVDDDADTRDAVAAVLAECGAEVMAFDCASDALAALSGAMPDVVVSDIAMPGMDGHARMRKIRGRGERPGDGPGRDVRRARRAAHNAAPSGDVVRARVEAAAGRRRPSARGLPRPLEGAALLVPGEP